MEETLVDIGLDRAEHYVISLAAMTPRIIAGVVVVIATWLIARLIYRLVGTLGGRVFKRTALAEVMQMLAATLVWILGIFIAAAVIFPSITPEDLMAALGLGSIAIGFAFKDIFENFFAGILILIREPFRIGDYIECDGVEGAVERIEVRETRVRQTDGQLIVVPNSNVFKKPVTVRTNMEYRRAMIICGVSYNASADEAREVIERAVKEVDSVRDDVRDVQVFAHGFGASSVDFEVAWWTGSRPVDIRASRDEVVRAIKRALDSEGIEIPFPQRTITIRKEEQDEE